jgi:hypothetical protein
MSKVRKMVDSCKEAKFLDLACKQAKKSHWSYLDDLGGAERRAALEMRGCDAIVFWDADYDVELAIRPKGFSYLRLIAALSVPVKYQQICEGLKGHTRCGYLCDLEPDERMTAIQGDGCTVVVFWDKPAKRRLIRP